MPPPSGFPVVIDADFVTNLRQASERLYVGGAGAITSTAVEFRVAVDLHGARDFTWPAREAAYAALVARGGVLLRWPVPDGLDLPDVLLDAAWLATRGFGPVLISCAAGISRSVSLAYAILALELDLLHEDALTRVALGPGEKGPAPGPLASARDWVERRRANGRRAYVRG
jgi:hypothetical protein